MKKTYLESFDNFKVFCYIWDDVTSPKGVVQIVHGMQEHAGRYADFAKYLNTQGYIAFASDLRGHGNTANDILGYYEGDLFLACKFDQIYFGKQLAEKYKLPVYLLGHSFGSFISQSIFNEPNLPYKKIILSGSAYSKTMLMKMAKVIAKCTYKFKGPKTQAKLIEKLSFGSYGKKYDKGNWLSRDDKVFEKYNQDDFCGKPFPAAFYVSFFTNILCNYDNLTNKDIPLLLVSGTKDPVGGKNASLCKKLYSTYQKAGLNVELHLVEDARHEVLNETNKKDTYKTIVDFIEK